MNLNPEASSGWEFYCGLGVLAGMTSAGGELITD